MQMCLLHSPLNTDLWASVDCSFCQRNECLHFLGPPDNDNDGCANALRLYLPPYTSKEELQVRKSATCFFWHLGWRLETCDTEDGGSECNYLYGNYSFFIAFFLWCFRVVLMLPTRCLDADTNMSKKRLRRRQCIQMRNILIFSIASLTYDTYALTFHLVTSPKTLPFWSIFLIVATWCYVGGSQWIQSVAVRKQEKLVEAMHSSVWGIPEFNRWGFWWSWVGEDMIYSFYIFIVSFIYIYINMYMRSTVSRYILNIQYTSNHRYDICWKTSWFNWCNWWLHKTATDVGWIYLWMIYDARSMTMMYDVWWKEWTHFMNTDVRSSINCQHSRSWSLDIMIELICFPKNPDRSRKSRIFPILIPSPE